MMPDRRTAPDRREQPRREAELRLHLARELVLTKARQVVEAMRAGPGAGTTVGQQLADLADLVHVWEAAEAVR